MRQPSNNTGNRLQLLANQIKRSFCHMHYPLESNLQSQLFKKSRVELPAEKIVFVGGEDNKVILLSGN